jgi:hypothetical protein
VCCTQAKYTARSHRMRQSDSFAALSMCLLVTMAFICSLAKNAYYGEPLQQVHMTTKSGAPSKRVKGAHPTQMYAFDDVMVTDDTQDTGAVVCSFESVVMRLRAAHEDTDSLGWSSDCASNFTSALLAFLLVIICQQHGYRFVAYVHTEPNDGKSVCDSHTGQTARVRSQAVDKGRNINCAAEYADVLTQGNLTNTMVNRITIDKTSALAINEALKKIKVDNIKGVREWVAEYAPDGAFTGLRAILYSGVCPGCFVPAEEMFKVTAELVAFLRSRNGHKGSLTGVSFSGQSKPSRVTVSQQWKRREDTVKAMIHAKHDSDAAAAAVRDAEPVGDGPDVNAAAPLPVVSASIIVPVGKGGSKQTFLHKCRKCLAVRASEDTLAEHPCTTPSRKATVAAMATRLLRERAWEFGTDDRRPPGTEADAQRATVQRQQLFGPGWACRKKRDSFPLSEDAKAFLLDLYKEGSTGRWKHNGYSAINAMQAALTPSGAPRFTISEIPPTSVIKSFFHSRWSDLKTAAQSLADCSM